MIGWQFSEWVDKEAISDFDRLFKIFKELLLFTSGDVNEAISWLTELDNGSLRIYVGSLSLTVPRIN